MRASWALVGGLVLSDPADARSAERSCRCRCGRPMELTPRSPPSIVRVPIGLSIVMIVVLEPIELPVAVALLMQHHLLECGL